MTNYIMNYKDPDFHYSVEAEVILELVNKKINQKPPTVKQIIDDHLKNTYDLFIDESIEEGRDEGAIEEVYCDGPYPEYSYSTSNYIDDKTNEKMLQEIDGILSILEDVDQDSCAMEIISYLKEKRKEYL